MPEDTIDGSNLELTDQSSTQAETVEQQVQTETVQPEPTQTTQPPQTNIPEQYRDKSPEELIHELQKRDSMLGRYKAEVSNLRTRPQQVPVYNPQIPSSLPGQEALGQRIGQQIDVKKLNENFFETPVEVLVAAMDPLVERRVMQGIQSYEQLQNQRRAMTQEQHNQWVRNVDDDETAHLRLEEGYTPEHEALMEALGKRENGLREKLEAPNITEQEIRTKIRELYAKADKILKGQLQDPEKIKALNIAQKQAAANGAPATRASSTAGPSSSPLEDWGKIDPRLAEDYAFMVELSRKSSS